MHEPLERYETLDHSHSMLLSLPDELILSICELLNLLDVRSFCLVSRRIHDIAASNARHVVFRIQRLGDVERPRDWTVLNDALCKTRALLVYFEDSGPECSSDDVMGLSLATNIEYLSFSIPSESSGSGAYLWDCMGSGDWPFTLHNLTHLECIGFKLPSATISGLGNAFPALVELTLIMPDQNMLYRYSEVGKIIESLGDCPLESFVISLNSGMSLIVLRNALATWPNLRVASFDSPLQPNQSFTVCGYHEPDIWLIPRHTHLQYLSLFNCPTIIRRNTPRALSAGVQSGNNMHIGAGTITDSEDSGRLWFVDVYAADVRAATALIAVRCPALKLVDWIVPDVSMAHSGRGQCRKVWCQVHDERSVGRWEVVSPDENYWPLSDTDKIFSVGEVSVLSRPR